MNGRIVVSKPLYVTLPQRKEDCEAHLVSQYMQRMQVNIGQMFNPGSAVYFVPTMSQSQRSYFPQMAQMRATPQWPAQPQMRPGTQPAAFQAMHSAPFARAIARPYVAASRNPGMGESWIAEMNSRPITGQQPNAAATARPSVAASQNPGMRAGMNAWPITGQQPNAIATAALGLLGAATARLSVAAYENPGMRAGMNSRPITGQQPNAAATARPSVAASQNPSMRAGINTRMIIGQLPHAPAVAASRARVAMGPTDVGGATRPAAIASANVNQARPATYKYTSKMRIPPQPQTVPQAVAQKAVHIEGQEPLTLSMLADANAQEQKKMFGERLFPVIQRWYPDLAGKITGMLLEIDSVGLLYMLEHEESLKALVEEAVAVLEAYHAKETLSVTGGIKKEA